MSVIIGNQSISDGYILSKVYPIGSIYLSINNTNPSSLFGGTWVAWGSGRVPVGVDADQTEFATVEKTGGNKNLQSHTHSISGTAASAGAHTHSVSITSKSGGSHYHQLNRIGALTNDSDAHNRYFMTGSTTTGKIPTSTEGAHTHSVSGNTGSKGDHTHTLSGTSGSAGSGSSQNLQPYITCYMWKRTA